jgi:two-component system OmpR family response regulator
MRKPCRPELPPLRPALDLEAESDHMFADTRKLLPDLTQMTRRILIIEDDTETASYVRKGLEECGFAVELAENGRDGLFLATDGGVDAIILDRMLPELDGLSILKAVRAAGITVPVLMLTAMSAVDERVRGLRAGADDYLVKPFSFDELHARIETLLRRPHETREETRLVCGDLELVLLTRTAQRGNRGIELQHREYQMLEYLMRRKGRVVTRTMLLEGLWDYRFDPQTNVIDVHISHLRKKIDVENEVPLIKTIRGSGYMISADD